MINCLIEIRLITTSNGWMIEYNNHYLTNKAGDNCWGDLSDALVVLRNSLEFLDFDDRESDDDL
jgi:hypothetical protein